MRTPGDAAEWAAAKYRTGHREWLAAPDDGEALTFRLLLHAPTESAAARDVDAVARWIAEWRRATWPAGCDAAITWKAASWRSFGRQELPVRLTVRGADSLAALARSGPAWRRLVQAANVLRRAWPDHDLGLPRIAAQLEGLDGADLGRLVGVVDWLVEHPDSGLLPRQLPVEGVDTKWLERHRRLVAHLKAALTESADLGLVSLPMRFTARVLDLAVPGVAADQPRALSAATAELARLPWKPEWVLIVENAQTLLALPPLAGAVAVFGKGKDAPELAAVPWIKQCRRLLYWGDLDTHGFHILSLVRRVLPQAESVLMDEATLDRFLALAGQEPKPFAGPISHLTEPELRALNRLRERGLRLEQERVDMAHAEAVLCRRQS
jgi:hypothetical protein